MKEIKNKFKQHKDNVMIYTMTKKRKSNYWKDEFSVYPWKQQHSPPLSNDHHMIHSIMLLRYTKIIISASIYYFYLNLQMNVILTMCEPIWLATSTLKMPPSSGELWGHIIMPSQIDVDCFLPTGIMIVVR